MKREKEEKRKKYDEELKARVSKVGKSPMSAQPESGPKLMNRVFGSLKKGALATEEAQALMSEVSAASKLRKQPN